MHGDRRIRRLGLVAAALISALLVGSCHREPIRREVEGELSPKLNPFIHFEQGTLLFIGVDGRAARYVKKGTMFPLGLGLANLSRGSLTLKRESLVLEDSQGRRYPVVTVEEFNRDYRRSRADIRLMNSFLEVMRTRYSNFLFTPWRLFPFKGENTTASDAIELGRRQWTLGYLYFPVPENGIHDQSFTLLVNMDEVEDTLIINFRLQ